MLFDDFKDFEEFEKNDYNDNYDDNYDDNNNILINSPNQKYLMILRSKYILLIIKKLNFPFII